MAENIQSLKYPVGSFLNYGVKGEHSYNECIVLTGYNCYTTFIDGESSKRFMSLVDWFIIKQMSRYRGITDRFGNPFTLCGASPISSDELYFMRLRQAEATVIAEEAALSALPALPALPLPPPAEVYQVVQAKRSKRAERRYRQRQSRKSLQ